MLNGKRIAIVLPAYNAEKTLETTVRELPELADIRILVDDHSSDRTVALANRLGLQFYVQDRNYGYGRNQQTCYGEALARAPTWSSWSTLDYQSPPVGDRHGGIAIMNRCHRFFAVSFLRRFLDDRGAKLWRRNAMECPYCHVPLSPDTPCLAHPPVPMCYWPHPSAAAEAHAVTDAPNAPVRAAAAKTE